MPRAVSSNIRSVVAILVLPLALASCSGRLGDDGRHGVVVDDAGERGEGERGEGEGGEGELGEGEGGEGEGEGVGEGEGAAGEGEGEGAACFIASACGDGQICDFAIHECVPDQCRRAFVLDSQSAVNALGAMKCEHVDSLAISSVNHDVVVSLAPLSTIEETDHDVSIFRTNLTNLAGLEHLRQIGGRLAIEQNDELTSLALPSLEFVFSFIEINSCPQLSVIHWPPGLAQIFQVSFDRLPALTEISGLETLTSVGEEAGFGTLTIRRAPLLPPVDFPSLVVVGGGVTIDDNDSFNRMPAFPMLYIGSIDIENMKYLVDGGTFPSLLELRGVAMIGNRAMTTPPQFPIATSAGSIEIIDNPELVLTTPLVPLATGASQVVLAGYAGTDLSMIRGITNVTSLSVLPSPTDSVPNGLETLSGIESLTTIYQSIDIEACPLLTSLDPLTPVTGESALTLAALPQITSVQIDNPLRLTGGLTLRDMPGLGVFFAPIQEVGDVVVVNTALPGFGGFLGGIPFPQEVWRVDVEDNPVMTSMNELAFLGGINEDLTIHNNAALTSLDGLQSLVLALGSVRITDNASLAAVNLDALTDVGSLDIERNNIASLSGLGALQDVGTDFIVDNNAALCNAPMPADVLAQLSAPPSGTIATSPNCVP